MWFTRLFKTKKAGQIFCAGGVASMGWGTNASSCAQMLYKDKKVINLVGDSSFIMTMYALKTAKEYNLPISYVVFNDSSLGNVRDVLSRKSRDMANFPQTNFAELAEGMGIKGIRVENFEELTPAIEETIKSNELMLLDLFINQKASHLRIRRS